MNASILMLLMVVLASLFECMVRFKIVNKSPNHLTTHGLTFAVRCRVCSELLNRHSPSPMLVGHGRGCGCGHGGGRAAAHVSLNHEEEAPLAGEQHVEEPILEEPSVA